MIAKENFFTSIKHNWEKRNTLACVGLDSEYLRLPDSVKVSGNTRKEQITKSLLQFNKEIIDSTSDLVCCYKLQFAFYAAEGEGGIDGLKQTINYIHTSYPSIPVILDAKRADIGSTAEKYAVELFDVFNADAATLSPLFGRESCEPFLKLKEKGLFFLCHTSNPGAAEFQDLMVTQGIESETAGTKTSKKLMPLYQYIAAKIDREWNENGNCALIVGATYPEQLSAVRSLVGDLTILVPGLGKQEGDAKAAILAGKDSQGCGMIVSSSRGIIYASENSDFAVAARRSAIEFRDLINTFR